MFVNLKINMCCNNNTVNGSKKNSKYGNWHFKSDNNYDYVINCDKVEVIVRLNMELIW